MKLGPDMNEDEKAQFRFIQSMIVTEVEPIFRKYFGMGPPVGMIACYTVASKLKLMYEEILRTTVDKENKDSFDAMIRELDRETKNEVSVKSRYAIEIMSKMFMGPFRPEEK